jgi:GNAT superfamily N-acetyltransferase
MTIIRTLSEADKEAFATLLLEMQQYYRARQPSPQAILAELRELPPGVQILVAANAEEAMVGFAAYAAIYPGPGLKSGLFLKELFVSERSRGRGIGKRLLRAVAQEAVARGYARVDWTADGRDARLMDFYANLGGERQEEKVFFRLTGDALTALASEPAD